MYNKFAEVYDLLMEDAPYHQWIDFIEFIKPSSYSSVLDMGCGTGEISLRLAHQGNKVKAFDLSHDMIEVAKSKNDLVSFSQNDIRTFHYDNKFDLIISYCDVINYITEEAELYQAFTRAFQHLDENGVFTFDVHSINYVNWLIEHEVFSEINDDISYVWFTEKGEEPGEVHHDLTFFVKEHSELYHRYDERHFQKAFPVETYINILNQVGFTDIEVYEDFSHEKSDRINPDSSRIFFVCNKGN